MPRKRKSLAKIEGSIEGYCGVDSGQLMIVDPCYVMTDEQYDELLADDAEYRPIRSVRHHITKNTVGVVVRTGYGDGCYPVNIKLNAEGRVMSVTVTFIEN
jgi:hypothetical protein